MAFIYVLENNINGKKYVGKTAHNVTRRVNRHKTSPHAIGNAIRKYGFENFSLHITKINPNEDLAKKELEAMSINNSIYPTGYNLVHESAGVSTHSKISRIKISNANKGRKATKEQKLRLGLGHMKPVYCVTDDIYFLSIKYASEHYGIKNQHISAQCKGKYIGKLKNKKFIYAGGVKSHSNY
jgi:group I intron endonuclease